VHRRLVEERDQGVAVIIVSSELDEIYALADRIAVMYEGKITGFRPPTVPVAELGLLMAGAATAEGADPEAMDLAAVTEAGNPALGVTPVTSTEPVVTTYPADGDTGAGDGPTASRDDLASEDGPPGGTPPGGPDGQADPA
jgi:energy-coupling factor transporter ATP-binding protein EcfA2